jgi:hypothetical protein
LARVFSIAYAYLVLVPTLLAPLAFGAQEPEWTAAAIIPLAAAALFVDPGALSRTGQVALWLIVATALALTGLVAFQHYSGANFAHQIWREAGQAAGFPLTPHAGTSARLPLYDVLPGVAPMVAFVAGVGLGHHRIRSRSLLKAVAVLGSGYATLFLLLHYLEPNMVLWRQKTHHLGVLTGSFFNRNVAAAYLAIGFVAAIVLACHSMLAVGRDSRRAASTQPVLAAAGMAAVIFLAILLTRSRAGTALAILAATVGGLLTLRPALSSATLWGRRAIWIASVLCATGLTALAMGELANRFADTERVDEARFAVYRATLRIIADNPYSGVGIGRFGDAFPAYRSADIPAGGIWDRAHNTYLQIAAEAGLPFLMLALLPVLLVFGSFAGKALGRNAGSADILGFSVLMMPLGHSLVDYPGQIAGYSIPLTVLTGLLFSRRHTVEPLGQASGSRH